MGCGVTFAKVVLVVFNVFFLLFGGILLAIGIVVIARSELLERVELIQDIQDLEDSELVQVAAYILIAVGGFMVLVSVCGVIGAIRESQCFLGIFITCILLVMAAEITIATITLIYQDEIEVYIKDHADDLLEDGKYTHSNGSFSTEAKLLNEVQIYLKCCGVNKKEDYQSYAGKIVSCPTSSTNTTVLVPPTCFEIKNDIDTVKLSCNDVDLGAGVHSDACADALQDFADKWAIVFVALTLGFVCLEIFGLVFAICLCRIGGKGE